jgi:predicted MPP superfamily phosphohydrolase
MSYFMSKGHYIIKSFFIAMLLISQASAESDQNFKHDITPPPSPWVGKVIDDNSKKFTFALFSDLNGGEREHIFEVAAAQLALFKPDFIVSIGDLIVGGTEDEAQLQKEWDSFDERADKAGAPIFRVGGNHDLSNVKMRDVWADRYGPRYYHFVYSEVLFLILDSEDFSEKRMQEIYHARAAAFKVLDGPNPEAARNMEYSKMFERDVGEISQTQSNYFKKVLAQNSDVKWTFLFMHKPAWKREDGKGLDKIEEALNGRSYTVFNGHEHSFLYEVKNDMDYIMLGTTGGGQNPTDENSFDHLTLITMDPSGPNISHIKMEGILDKTGNIPENGNDFCYQRSKCGK